MDTTTLLIIIVVVVLVLYFMNRSRGGFGPMGGTRRGGGYGPERPTYDDPDYTSSGSIGGAPSTPNFPTTPSSPASHRRDGGGVTLGDDAPSAPSSSRNDDPNYRSGGSIGGA